MKGQGPRRSIVGRGAARNPKNRFERIEVEPDETEGDEPRPETVYLRDHSRSIIARNDSPDIGFDASINPYRGCSHGCVYCSARPTHEYLGLSAGLDFESRILVKQDAPELLKKELISPLEPTGALDEWRHRPLPTRREGARITRRCLEVLAEFRNPVVIVTKNYLVTRDMDLLSELASHEAAAVAFSLTTLDDDLRRIMEPRTSRPARRLAAVEKLAAGGIPVGVMTAPVIPGLNDHELPNPPLRRSGGRSDLRRLRPRAAPLRCCAALRGLAGSPLPRTERQGAEPHPLDARRRAQRRQLWIAHEGGGLFAQHIAQLFSISCRRAGMGEGALPEALDRCVPRRRRSAARSLRLTEK